MRTLLLDSVTRAFRTPLTAIKALVASLRRKESRGRDQRGRGQDTGMGRAICKAVIEARGGTIGVTSQVGHGSVFYFSLPV